MRLRSLLEVLAPTGMQHVAFPHYLLGGFRRRSITFCDGTTDETTVVYWFQSASFTIDLRLPDGFGTAVVDRQGWLGRTLWDGETEALSWDIAESYQPRIQWPEPAHLRAIGNTVIEFAPSGAYVEDWRQQATRGPLLGLRLLRVGDGAGDEVPRGGGLIVAGEHMAFVQARPAQDEAAVRQCSDLAEALSTAAISEAQVEGCEVSVAIAGDAVSHSTIPARVGRPIIEGEFMRQPDGTIRLERPDGTTLHFAVDLFVEDFTFANSTPCTSEAAEWMQRERAHLSRHAAVLR